MPGAAMPSSNSASPFATLIEELDAAWSEAGDLRSEQAPRGGNPAPQTAKAGVQREATAPSNAATSASVPVRTPGYPFASSALEVSSSTRSIAPLPPTAGATPSPTVESRDVWIETSVSPQVNYPVQGAKAVPSAPREAPPAQTFSPEAPVVVAKGAPNMPEPHASMKKTAAHPASTASAAKNSAAVAAPVPAQDENSVIRPATSSAGKGATPTSTPDDSPEQPAANVTAADPNIQAQPIPPAANSVPTEFRHVRIRGQVSVAIPSGPKPSTGTPIPFFAAPAPVPVPIPSPKFKDAGGSGSQERASTPPRTEDATPVERAAVNDAALEVRIKAPEHETNPKPVATNVDPGPPVSVTPTPSEPVTLKPLPELPTAAPALQGVSAAAVNPAHAAPAEVTVRTPETPAHPQTQSPPSTARSSDIEEPVPARDVQQPLKSVSLEFSPDGAGDVRLRLSEKSGEIHISLHSSDASLSSRLHEGVHDLVGSLSSAGYEAEAWTPGQGHQHSQREPEQRRNRRADSKEAGEAFGDVFQQPIQEIS
jgi:hypothetical protein